MEPAVVLITGATSGIGKEIVRRLATSGWTVLVGARDVEAGEKAAAEVGGSVVALDVTDPAGIAAAAAAVPALDVLVLQGDHHRRRAGAGVRGRRDSVDYAIDPGSARFAVFDGMGHGVQTAQLASLAVAAYRNARRSSQSLLDTAQIIDVAVTSAFRGAAFTTGVLAHLDTDTGLLTWINDGHPEPLLQRGHRLVKSLHARPGLPFGLSTAAGRTKATLPPSAASSVSRATGSCSTPTASPRPAPRTAIPTERSSRPTCSAVTWPPGCPHRRPCAGSSAPCWPTSRASCATTPLCCSWNGVAATSKPSCPNDRRRGMTAPERAGLTSAATGFTGPSHSLDDERFIGGRGPGHPVANTRDRMVLIQVILLRVLVLRVLGVVATYLTSPGASWLPVRTGSTPRS